MFQPCFGDSQVCKLQVSIIIESDIIIYLMNCTGLKTWLIFALKNVVKEIANYNKKKK